MRLPTVARWLGHVCLTLVVSVIGSALYVHIILPRTWSESLPPDGTHTIHRTVNLTEALALPTRLGVFNDYGAPAGSQLHRLHLYTSNRPGHDPCVRVWFHDRSAPDCEISFRGVTHSHEHQPGTWLAQQ